MQKIIILSLICLLFFSGCKANFREKYTEEKVVEKFEENLFHRKKNLENTQKKLILLKQQLKITNENQKTPISKEHFQRLLERHRNLFQEQSNIEQIVQNNEEIKNQATDR